MILKLGDAKSFSSTLPLVDDDTASSRLCAFCTHQFLLPKFGVPFLQLEIRRHDCGDVALNCQDRKMHKPLMMLRYDCVYSCVHDRMRLLIAGAMMVAGSVELFPLTAAARQLETNAGLIACDMLWVQM